MGIWALGFLFAFLKLIAEARNQSDGVSYVNVRGESGFAVFLRTLG